MAEQFRRKHYDLAYISTLLQSADILTKPFTNIDKWKKAVFLIGHVHVKPSRPASAVIESDYTPPRRNEPKYDGIIIEWGHDQASSLLGRADEASIGNQLIVRVTHGMISTTPRLTETFSSCEESPEEQYSYYRMG